MTINVISCLFWLLALGVFLMLTEAWNVAQVSIKIKLRNRTFWGYIIVIFAFMALGYFVDQKTFSSPEVNISFGNNNPGIIRAWGYFLWPVTIFILAIIIIFSVNKLIKNGGRIDTPYGSIYMPTGEQQPIPPKDELLKSTPELDSLNKYQQLLYNNLKHTTDNLPENERILKLLIMLTINVYSEQFERLYNVIFGSQLLALIHLNQTVSYSGDLKEFYDKHTVRIKTFAPNLTPATFEEWKRFLLNCKLVRENVSQLILEPYGVEFIGFLINRRYPLDKLIN